MNFAFYQPFIINSYKSAVIFSLFNNNFHTLIIQLEIKIEF